MPELKKNTQRDREGGVALLIVLSAIALLTIISTDIQFNARVDATLAENGRDELIAYYNAKSALDVELAILRAVRQAQSMLQQMIPGLPLGSLVGMVPAECGLISQLVTLEADDKPLPINGECNAKAIAEKGKIDVNRLGNISDKFRIRLLILGQLMDPRFDRYFEEANSNGDRITREDLVGYLGDYVDPDTVRDGTAGSDEDDVYARLKERYRVKNAPYDSVAELQLVFGIDDELYEVLRNVFTVYPVGGVSITTADLATIAAVIRQAAVNPSDPALFGDPMLALLGQIMELRKIPLAGAINGQALTALALTMGIALDAQKIRDLTDDSNALDWYTIQATGQSNAVEKRITATYNLASNQLVYYREE